MKIKYECKYNAEDVAKLIESQHSEKYPLPEGMKWIGVFESYSGVTVTAIKEEKDDTKSEVPLT